MMTNPGSFILSGGNLLSGVNNPTAPIRAFGPGPTGNGPPMNVPNNHPTGNGPPINIPTPVTQPTGNVGHYDVAPNGSQTWVPETPSMGPKEPMQGGLATPINQVPPPSVPRSWTIGAGNTTQLTVLPGSMKLSGSSGSIGNALRSRPSPNTSMMRQGLAVKSLRMR